MKGWLQTLLASLLGSAGSRVLTGAGLGLASFAAFSSIISVALNSAAAAFGGLPSAIAALIYISGMGTAMSAIGSAILTRAAIESARVSLRVVQA